MGTFGRVRLIILFFVIKTIKNFCHRRVMLDVESAPETNNIDALLRKVLFLFIILFRNLYVISIVIFIDS